MTGHDEKAADTMYLSKACKHSEVKYVLVHVAPILVLIMVKIPILIWVCQVGLHAFFGSQVIDIAVFNGKLRESGLFHQYQKPVSAMIPQLPTNLSNKCTVLKALKQG